MVEGDGLWTSGWHCLFGLKQGLWSYRLWCSNVKARKILCYLGHWILIAKSTTGIYSWTAPIRAIHEWLSVADSELDSYADDNTLWTTGDCSDIIQNNLQTSLNSINDWFIIIGIVSWYRSTNQAPFCLYMGTKQKMHQSVKKRWNYLLVILN